MDQEMLQMMRSLFDEHDEKIRVMVKEEVGSVREELGSFKEEVREEFKGVKLRLDKLEKGQQEQMQFERETRVLLEKAQTNIKALAEGHGLSVEKYKQLDRIERTLEEVRSDVAVIGEVVSWHSKSIKRLNQKKG